ncbi:MAG: hypothetical protein NVS9B4_00360 [Candidatus Acidiferrum sp.]
MTKALFIFGCVVASLYGGPIACTPTGAANVTITGTLASSTSLTDVTCGPVLFTNFRSIDSSGGTTTGNPVSLVAGASNFDSATGIATLSFNPNYQLLTTMQDTHLLFDVRSAQTINRAGLMVGGAGVGGIDERLCAGSSANIDVGSGVCINGAQQLASLAAVLGGTSSVPLSTPSSAFGVFKDIGTKGLLTGVSETFHTDGNVPEPVTSGLVGLGLTAVILIRRRRSA